MSDGIATGCVVRVHAWCWDGKWHETEAGREARLKREAIEAAKTPEQREKEKREHEEAQARNWAALGAHITAFKARNGL